MEISFEGIVLRPWSSTDAEQLAGIGDNKKIADNLRDGFPNPYTLDDATGWLKMILPENDPPRFFAIVVDNLITGSIGIVTKTDIYRKNVEIGYFIAEEYWGKGIATKLSKLQHHTPFPAFDIVRVYAEPFADNPGSKRALEKAVSRHEATFRKNVIKNGIIKDSCIYSVLKEEFRGYQLTGVRY